MIRIDEQIKREGEMAWLMGVTENPYPCLSEKGLSCLDGCESEMRKSVFSHSCKRWQPPIPNDDARALATGCRVALVALEQIVAPNRVFSNWENHNGEPIDDQLNNALITLRYLEDVNWYGVLKAETEKDSGNE